VPLFFPLIVFQDYLDRIPRKRTRTARVLCPPSRDAQLPMLARGMPERMQVERSNCRSLDSAREPSEGVIAPGLHEITRLSRRLKLFCLSAAGLMFRRRGSCEGCETSSNPEPDSGRKGAPRRAELPFARASLRPNLSVGMFTVSRGSLRPFSMSRLFGDAIAHTQGRHEMFEKSKPPGEALMPHLHDCWDQDHLCSQFRAG